MLVALGNYIKLAIDIEREVAAGGGVAHADCETVLLEDGSRQHDVWGADWIPSTQETRFEALINIRPEQDNRSMTILDAEIRAKVQRVAEQLLGDT